MTKIIIHQGDVLLTSVDAIPKTAQPVETKGVAYLAYGETTGHSHHLIGPRVAMFAETGGGSGGTYVALATTVPLEHGVVGDPATADHATIELPAGKYEVVRQVNWSDDLEPRVVQD